MTQSNFAHTYVPSLGRSVHRLGLACNYGIDEATFETALDRGMNYIFWTSLKTGHLRPALIRRLKQDRDRYILATGPAIGFFGGSVRRAAESILRKFQTDCIDVFHLFWVGRTSALTASTLGEIEKLKAEGKVRSLAISIHDRERAGELVQDSPIDVFMLRYNAAHPGAEHDVFPYFAQRKDAARPGRPGIVAYTATSWRKLLKAPRSWPAAPMTASDCYRFCLSNPNVDIVLTGPSSAKHVEENFSGLERGPLSEDEAKWMREFGAVVHG